MREVLDCGVLLAPGHEAAMQDWVGRHPSRLTRLRLHLVPLAAMRYGAGQQFPAPAAPEGPDVRALARLAVALKRYDACILPVAPASLAWTRMALQQAGGLLSTPVLLLVRDVKAPAIEDLLGLGAWDFMAQPACPESLRVRLGRLARPGGLRDIRLEALREPAAAYPAAAYPVAANPVAARPGVAAGLRQAGASRPRVPADVVEQALSGLRHQHHRGAQESFRTAKARVVDGFERDYIRLALSRHGGNVAQAARACSKHRRAFWALMRKHGIQAAPYRQAAQESED
ncbi:helix-turn-helix domain-containing protein [Achromobacter denitrificans]